jgi:hypothetical protein
MTTARATRAQRRRNFPQSQPGSSQISARSLHAFHSMTIACLTLAMPTGGRSLRADIFLMHKRSDPGC